MAGRDLLFSSTSGDVVLQAAKLNAGGNITLSAKQGKIVMLVDKAQSYENTKKHTENLVWWKERETGSSAETIVHNQLRAGGKIRFDAGRGVIVEYQEGGKVEDAIRTLSKKPELAWMQQLQTGHDVQWRSVKGSFDKWDYKSEGLTEGAAAAIAIAVTIATDGAGTSLLAAGGISVAETSAVGLAINAGVSTIASRATVSLINNKGDVGKVLKELGSDQFIKSLATSMLTAGLTAGLPDVIPAAYTPGTDLVGKLQNNLMKNLVAASVQTGIQGGSFGKNFLNGLKMAEINSLLASVDGLVGDLTDGATKIPVANLLAHAVVGGLASEALCGNFVSGAAAGLASALGVQGGLYNGLTPKQVAQLSQIIGASAALLAGGKGVDVNQGAATAQSAALNNYLTHAQLEVAKDILLRIKECSAAGATTCKAGALQDALSKMESMVELSKQTMLN